MGRRGRGGRGGGYTPHIARLLRVKGESVGDVRKRFPALSNGQAYRIKKMGPKQLSFRERQQIISRATLKAVSNLKRGIHRYRPGEAKLKKKVTFREATDYMKKNWGWLMGNSGLGLECIPNEKKFQRIMKASNQTRQKRTRAIERVPNTPMSRSQQAQLNRAARDW